MIKEWKEFSALILSFVAFEGLQSALDTVKKRMLLKNKITIKMYLRFREP